MKRRPRAATEPLIVKSIILMNTHKHRSRRNFCLRQRVVQKIVFLNLWTYNFCTRYEIDTSASTQVSRTFRWLLMSSKISCRKTENKKPDGNCFLNISLWICQSSICFVGQMELMMRQTCASHQFFSSHSLPSLTQKCLARLFFSQLKKTKLNWTRVKIIIDIKTIWEAKLLRWNWQFLAHCFISHWKWLSFYKKLKRVISEYKTLHEQWNMKIKEKQKSSTDICKSKKCSTIFRDEFFFLDKFFNR